MKALGGEGNPRNRKIFEEMDKNFLNQNTLHL